MTIELPLAEALKRAYYYTELGDWRGPEVDEFDRWHAVAKIARLAIEQDRARRGESVPVSPVPFDLQSDRAALINAAHRIDWVQVALNVNHGPPCFHVEGDGRFCLRAETWAGHGEADHDFVPLSAMIAGTSTPVYSSPQPSIDPADRERVARIAQWLEEGVHGPELICEAAALLRKAYLS